MGIWQAFQSNVPGAQQLKDVTGVGAVLRTKLFAPEGHPLYSKRVEITRVDEDYQFSQFEAESYALPENRTKLHQQLGCRVIECRWVLNHAWLSLADDRWKVMVRSTPSRIGAWAGVEYFDQERAGAAIFVEDNQLVVYEHEAGTRARKYIWRYATTDELVVDTATLTPAIGQSSFELLCKAVQAHKLFEHDLVTIAGMA